MCSERMEDHCCFSAASRFNDFRESDLVTVAKWLFKWFDIFYWKVNYGHWHCISILTCSSTWERSRAQDCGLCPLGWVLAGKMKDQFSTVQSLCSPESLISASIKDLYHQVILGDLFSPITFNSHFTWMSWLHSHNLLVMLSSCSWDMLQSQVWRKGQYDRAQWQGNNGEPTAKCPTNLERTSHDVKKECNKSLSTGRLCRPHQRVTNYGKELSTEVYKPDRLMF